LFLGAHPDDVEIAASGAILRLGAAGCRVALLDATAGEKGSRGTPADRAAEAQAAAAALGAAWRQCLGLPDTAVVADDRSTRALVAALRSARPRLFWAPSPRDVHPDHLAVAALAERAFFLAGLLNFATELGPPHRPRLLIRYPGNVPQEPAFVVPIDDLVDRKAAVLRCYRSQLQPPDRAHLVQGLDVLERAQVRDRFYGARVGCAAAEPFLLDGPLPLRDLAPLMA
jgi:bacillithiol biosynthesis deacetylase BshB1